MKEKAEMQRIQITDKRTTVVGATLACLFICSVALGCMVTVAYTCGTPQHASCTNSCVEVYYVPSSGAYCDSRDGYPGTWTCGDNSVPLYQYTWVGSELRLRQ